MQRTSRNLSFGVVVVVAFGILDSKTLPLSLVQKNLELNLRMGKCFQRKATAKLYINQILKQITKNTRSKQL